MGEYLAHHGIKGQKWGVRRFQNPDGSLTAKGRARVQKMYDRSVKSTKRASEYHAKEAESTKERMEYAKKVGIYDPEVSSRYAKLMAQKKEATDVLRTGKKTVNGDEVEVDFDRALDKYTETASKIGEYESKGSNSVGVLDSLFTGKSYSELAIKSALSKEYISELETSRKESISKAKEYTNKNKALMNMDINEFMNQGDYKKLKKDLKSMR